MAAESHIVRDLYRRAYDAPRRAQPPARTYMIAAIPRTGSTYLGMKLWDEGVFGAPLEYLNFNVNKRIFRRLGRRGVVEYWDNLTRLRSSPNGTFGYKMFTANFLYVAENYPELLKCLNPDHVIYLTRSDRVSHAVSYARAIQTKRWFAAVPEQAAPVYCFDMIDRQVKSILSQEQAWEAIFELTGEKPLRISYESVVQSWSSVREKIADTMKVSLMSATPPPLPMIAKQADLVSEEWKERYLRELEARKRAMPERASASAR